MAHVPANKTEEFKYPFYARHFGGIGILASISLGLTLSLYGLNAVSEMKNLDLGLRMSWSISGVLVIICILIEAQSVMFSKIILNEKGISRQLRGVKFELFPRKNIKEIRWNDIEILEFFDSSDIDSVGIPSKKGIRLISGQKRFLIYENIINYSNLVKKIERHIPRGKAS